MNFLHTDFHGSQGDLALVTLDAQANVMLLDDSNFNAYRNGASFNYFGGWASKSPVRLAAPRSGHWHIVVDMGGAAGQVRASIRVVQRTLR